MFTVAQADFRPGLLFVLVGPAGVGKNSLMREAINEVGGQQLPTATTRPIRPGEMQGREHIFVSREEFQALIEQGALLEYQLIHGTDYYGMLRATVEAALNEDQLFYADIDVLGARIVRDLYPENVVTVFIQPPSIASLIERMRQRGEAEAEIARRLLRVPMELAYAEECDHVILNTVVEEAALGLCAVVRAERERLHARAQRTASAKPVPLAFVYEARVIVHSSNGVLRRDDGSLPGVEFADGEPPHQAAERALSSLIGVSVEGQLSTGGAADGNFLPPLDLHVERDGRVERIVYTYACDLEAGPAPAGWRWSSLHDVEPAGSPS